MHKMCMFMTTQTYLDCIKNNILMHNKSKNNLKYFRFIFAD